MSSAATPNRGKRHIRVSLAHLSGRASPCAETFGQRSEGPHREHRGGCRELIAQYHARRAVWRSRCIGRGWAATGLAGGLFVEIVARLGQKGRGTAVVLRGIGGALLAAVLLAAPALAQDDADDPLEPLNRGIFQFNRVLDGLLLEPAARMYRMATPQFFRTGVSNFLANLTTPVVLANDLLQGDFQRAELTLGRFMMNTILGLGGLIDVGGKLGMPPRHSEDFGQTLAVYGVGPGPI